MLVRGLVLAAGLGGGAAVVGGVAMVIAGTNLSRIGEMAVARLEGLTARGRVASSASVSASPDAAAPAPSGVRLVRAEAGRLPVLLPVARPVAPPTPSAPPMSPIVGQGVTRLPDSVVAIRKGDSVTVHFDVARVRTRRADKFERVVRATLPAVYGPAAASELARIPSGQLASEGDLLTDLPARGLRVPIGDGWALAVWPVTRPGETGPLVVMYRAVVTRER
jgi:hypothetical protein